jgi:hypothetical protein
MSKGRRFSATRHFYLKVSRLIIHSMTTTFKVHYDGSVLVPEQPVDLPIGRSVEVRVQEIPASPGGIGTAAALLAAVRATPPVTAEDAAALEHAIAAGRLPVRPGGIFDEPGEE